LEDFYDLLLKLLMSREISALEKHIRSMHAGKVHLETTRELPSLVYVDDSGFKTEVEDAGSGIVASLPIIFGMMQVKRGGVLIVEEPEAHLEPVRQMKLVELLCQEAIRRKIALMVTTHSDFLVKKVLGLISRGKIKNSQVGLLYFERKPKEFTTIRSIGISKHGEAEQPLFSEAVQTLTDDFSG